MRWLWLVSKVSQAFTVPLPFTIRFVHVSVMNPERYSAENLLMMSFPLVNRVISASFCANVWVEINKRKLQSPWQKVERSAARFGSTVATVPRENYCTVHSLSSCCLHLSAVHLASNLVHMVYICSSLMVCGHVERMERGGGISTGITKICHFIPCYWTLHSVSPGQGILCRGLRRLRLTLKAQSMYCFMDWGLNMTSFTSLLWKKFK